MRHSNSLFFLLSVAFFLAASLLPLSSISAQPRPSDPADTDVVRVAENALMQLRNALISSGYMQGRTTDHGAEFWRAVDAQEFNSGVRRWAGDTGGGFYNRTALEQGTTGKAWAKNSSEIWFNAEDESGFFQERAGLLNCHEISLSKSALPAGMALTQNLECFLLPS
ncbi:MAG: hypothetical protein EBZ48_11065 [Proteobacteria bacterium]|nr:hypothetical protein [Pseudomonadota bacterium]